MLDLSAIRINVQADAQDANKQLDGLKQKGENLSALGSKLTAGLTLPITAIGAASLMAANDAAEMESKFNTVFKTTSKEAKNWATEYGNAIGRSKYEVMSAISNQSDLMVGMGMTEKAAGDLSQKYIELAYDLASFNNVNDAQAIEAVTKAAMGETESMKMLGVNLSETVMANSEFVKSSGKAWKEMTMAEKAAARYEEAMKQSTNAIGDAKRTADGFANQLKRAKGNFNEIAVEIGNVMLPVFEKLITSFNNFLTSVLNFTKENPTVVQAVVVLAGALAALGPTMFLVGKAMTLFGTFTALIPIFSGVAIGVGLLGVAFVGLNEDAQKIATELPEKINSALQNALQYLLDNMPEFLAKGQEMLFKLIEGVAIGAPILLQTFVDICLNTIEAIFTYMPQFLEKGLQFVQNLLDGAIQKFPEFLGKFLEGILNVLKNIAARMPEFLQKGIDFVVNMTNGIAQNLPSIVAKIGELLTALIRKIIEYLPKFLAEGAKIVSEIIKGLWNNKGALVEAGGNLIKACWDACVNAVKSFINIGKSIVDNIKTGISNAWGGLTSWVSGMVKNIPIIGGFFSLENTSEGNELTSGTLEQGNLGLATRATQNLFAYNAGLNTVKSRIKENTGSIKTEQNITFNNTFNIQDAKDINIEEIAEDLAFSIERRLAFQ